MAKAPSWLHPTKHVMVEILGGGDSDGLYLDTYNSDPVVAEQAVTMYQMSAGGEVGRSHMGASVGDMMRRRRGERIDPAESFRQTHYYTLVEKVDEPDTMLLRFHYTAGCGFDDDGSELGWLNKAIHRFVEANYVDININRIIEFWVGMELRDRTSTSLERSLIEDNYKTGPLEDRLNAMIAAIAKREKIEVAFLIDGEFIRLRKIGKLNEAPKS